MPTDIELAAKYDPLSDAATSDPFPYLRALRHVCPVDKFSGPAIEYPLYTVSRHKDAMRMLLNHRVWSSKYGQTPYFGEPELGIRTDPPEHGIYRSLLAPLFEPKKVATMAPGFYAVASRLIDGFIERGACDLSKEFAQVYPITVMSDLLGVEIHRQEDFRRWTHDYTISAGSGDEALMRSSAQEIGSYFARLLDDRRAFLATNAGPGPDDVVGLFVRSLHPEGRPFRNEELLPTALLLLSGAIDTTSLLLSSCVRRLLEGGLWDTVRANPDLAEVAIEETLRFDPPARGLYRTNTAAATIRDTEIPPNSKCQASLISANRDEEVWEDPDNFRLDRDLETLRRHMTFGRGIHTCIGAHVARLDAKIALQVLTQRLPGLRLNGPYTMLESVMMWGVTSLPVCWDATLRSEQSTK